MARRPAQEGFLERMLGPVPGRSAPSMRWVGDPVRTHLALLLNTRQGAIQNLPDYGLPDVSAFYSDYPASMGQLRALIERLIKKYEPRLLNARVRLLDTDPKEFRASFLITGAIEEDEEVSPVQYRTTITGSGHATVGATPDE